MRNLRTWVAVPLLALLVAAGIAAAAWAKASAAPVNTTPPSISGTEREGSTLTASNGTWSNSPTSFAYQWQRCALDGTACGDIVGAKEKTYVLTAADVSHAVRVEVTAINADGRATATSQPTDPVSAKGGPTNTVRPAISGTARIGEELTSTNGSWTPTPTSFSRQWQRCDEDGANCRNIVGATGRTYGVRSADTGHRLRVVVAARTSGGVAYATSNPSAVVGGTTTATTVVTTTVAGNRAPTIVFVSLKRIGTRVYARFRVCDDRPGRITVIERDTKARALAYQRKFGVYRAGSCGTFSRSWRPASRFLTKGRYVVTLRAQDKSGRLSRIVSRSLLNR